MIINDWKGYEEGRDLTKIPPDTFAYPTKNVLVHKGKAFKRPGIELFGQAATGNDRIHGEYVWKDAQPGEMAIRSKAQKIQVYLEAFKTGDGWVDIFTALDADVQRVRFATWVDSNDSIVHTRLFFVDGSEDLYQWNGAVGVVASVIGDVITLEAGASAESLGFDDGSVTPQSVLINGSTYTYDNDPTGQDLNLTSTPTVAAGDLVIASPTVSTTTLVGFNKDHIYDYKNHLVLGNLESGQLYFSHIVTYPLDYTVPIPASRTAATPFFISLDGNVTATTERKADLWVSTQDDWFKITKLDSVNAYDLFVEVDKNETTERNGALPFAVTNFKGDTIFLAQDKTLQMITDSDLIQEDSIKLLSDEIALLLQRTNLNESRLITHERYIYIIAPLESTLVMYDTVDNYWQPPQIIGLSSMSVIEGDLTGHSNAQDVSFKMFRGRQDLGVDFEAIFAPGYITMDDEFLYKQFSKTGISGRTTASAEIKWETLYEAEGDKKILTREFSGSSMKLFSGSVLTPFGSVPFGSFPFAGAALEDNSDIKRFFLFDAGTAAPFFEYRPVITVNGSNVGFELTAYKVEEKAASRKVGNDHYVAT